MKTSFNRITKGSPAKAAAGLLVAMLSLASSSLALAVTLKDMSYATLPGNRLEVKLQFDGTPPEVKGYSIEKPARIALDLVGATSGLTSKYHNLGTGNARNITVVEAKDRTRLIVNLTQLAAGSRRRAEGCCAAGGQRIVRPGQEPECGRFQAWHSGRRPGCCSPLRSIDAGGC